jgi:AbrB family looped-hinge helix DNA binding protein
MQMSIDVLTVSSKGQIVLPSNMRKSLDIEAGDKLAVYRSGDVIMLKAIKMPTVKDFRTKVDEARKWATDVELKEIDIDNAVTAVRKKKRAAKSSSIAGDSEESLMEG